MKYLSTFLVLLFINASAFSQTQTQTPEFGVELSASLKQFDVNSSYDTPAFSNYLGFYTQFPLSNHFSIKFGAGLNQTFIHRDEFTGGKPYDGTDSRTDIVLPEENVRSYSISLATELRYYLSPAPRPRGNFYVSLPVTFEGAPIAREWSGRNELKIIPGLGYRYQFNRRWSIEAGAGLGCGVYFTPKEKADFGWKSMTLEHTVSLRLGYAF
jgi:hypothetical protein